jgi:hypothetical protein
VFRFIVETAGLPMTVDEFIDGNMVVALLENA